MKVEPSSVKTKSGRGKIPASGGLNLRDTPSAAGKVLLTIPEGTTVDITSAQGQWYKTSYQGKNGWVSANYLDIIQSYKQGKITSSGGLNLRESPSTSGEILMTIPQGVTVTITGDQQDWYKVTYREKAGWVFAEYVTVLTAENGGSGSDTVDLSPKRQSVYLRRNRGNQRDYPKYHSGNRFFALCGKPEGFSFVALFA